LVARQHRFSLAAQAAVLQADRRCSPGSGGELDLQQLSNNQEVAVIKALVLALVVGLAATTAAFAGTSAVPTKKAGQLTVGFDVPAPGF